jgi:type 1 glutamine amidotransferase
MERIITGILLLLLAMTACTPQSDKERMKIAVTTQTEGFRHNNIPVALNVIKNLAKENNWQLYHTEDPFFFTKDNLDTLDLIIFLQTTGNIFDDDQKQAIEHFVEQGGGLLTIHTGTVTENDWEWYIDNLGAAFVGHPTYRRASLSLKTGTTRPLPFFLIQSG